MKGLVKVVNTSDSIIHVSNIDSVMKKGGNIIAPESEVMGNGEIMGLVNAGLLSIESLNAEPEKQPEKESEVVESDSGGSSDEEAAESDTDDESQENPEESVTFSDADKNADPVSETSYVKSESGIHEVDPVTAERIEDGEEPKPGREFVDGIEVINPTKEITKKVNGVEIVVNGDEDGDEYDKAFIDG